MSTDETPADLRQITTPRLNFLFSVGAVKTFGEMLDSVPLPAESNETGHWMERIVVLLGYQWTVSTREAARQWQVAMLVTAVESYVEDIMKACATIQPTLLLDPKDDQSKEERTVKVERLVKATDCKQLIDELVAEWARRFVDRGPVKWLRVLRKWGLQSTVAGNDLAYLWARRNIVVHGTATVTAELAKNFPDRDLTVGEPLPCTEGKLAADLAAAMHLVTDVDRFLAARYSLSVV